MRQFPVTVPFALALASALVAAPAAAHARDDAPAFLSMGAPTDPPRGFVEMCLVDKTSSCPVPALFDNSASPLVGSDLVTGAIALAHVPVTPRARPICPLLDAGFFHAGSTGYIAHAWGGDAPFLGSARPFDATPTVSTSTMVCDDRPVTAGVSIGIAANDAGVDVPAARASTRAVTPGTSTFVDLKRVNRYVNHNVRQQTDAETFGRDEVWRRSGTGRAARGDCEDIAIEKRLQLIDGGFDPARLFLAVVYLREIGLHTVLVARLGDGDYVLDSRSPYVERWSRGRYSWVSIQDPGAPGRWFQPRMGDVDAVQTV